MLDFVDFLTVLAKFIMLHVFVQLGDFQKVKLSLLYKCFPVISFKARTCFSFLCSCLWISLTLCSCDKCSMQLFTSFSSTMNLEGNYVIAYDALIDNFLIFDRGCQSSGIHFLPFSSLLEEVWTLKFLNSGRADWSGIGLGILSVAGPVQLSPQVHLLHSSACTMNHLSLYMILSKIWHKAPLTRHMLFVEFQDFTDIHWSRHK